MLVDFLFRSTDGFWFLLKWFLLSEQSGAIPLAATRGRQQHNNAILCSSKCTKPLKVSRRWAGEMAQPLFPRTQVQFPAGMWPVTSISVTSVPRYWTRSSGLCWYLCSHTCIHIHKNLQKVMGQYTRCNTFIYLILCVCISVYLNSVLCVSETGPGAVLTVHFV